MQARKQEVLRVLTGYVSRGIWSHVDPTRNLPPSGCHPTVCSVAGAGVGGNGGDLWISGLTMQGTQTWVVSILAGGYLRQLEVGRKAEC